MAHEHPRMCLDIGLPTNKTLPSPPESILGPTYGRLPSDHPEPAVDRQAPTTRRLEDVGKSSIEVCPRLWGNLTRGLYPTKAMDGANCRHNCYQTPLSPADKKLGRRQVESVHNLIGQPAPSVGPRGARTWITANPVIMRLCGPETKKPQEYLGTAVRRYH